MDPPGSIPGEPTFLAGKSKSRASSRGGVKPRLPAILFAAWRGRTTIITGSPATESCTTGGSGSGTSARRRQGLTWRGLGEVLRVDAAAALMGRLLGSSMVFLTAKGAQGEVGVGAVHFVI